MGGPIRICLEIFRTNEQYSQGVGAEYIYPFAVPFRRFGVIRDGCFA